MTEQEIKALLKKSVCKITFEKVDGSTRILTATLRDDILPPIPEGTGKGKRTFGGDAIPVWSIDDQGWRSFKLSLLISIEEI